MSERRAIEVLEECCDLMRRKGEAYNRIPQNKYYDPLAPLFKDDIGGEGAIYVMMHQKMTRLMSLLVNRAPNDFEGIDDSARDLINYTAFIVEHVEGKMDGQ